jgi:hypothetical protein
LKFNLNEDGLNSCVDKSGFVLLRWIGTMIGGEPASTATDIGNRRLRFLAYAQVSKDTWS